jgi:hypothetical protein
MPYGRHELGGLPPEILDDPIHMGVCLDDICHPTSLHTLEGAQVVAPEHVWVTPENYSISKGNTAGAARVVGPYLEIDMIITDPETIRGIEAKEIGEISAGYHADSVFENGDLDGNPYCARQVGIKFNHIAIIPFSTGRAGEDVRILNSKSITNKGEHDMSDVKQVRVRLRNTGRYVNVDEEAAAALGAEEEASTAAEGVSGSKLEELMAQVEGLNAQIAALQAEAEEGKGELSVYKEKLDELLSTEAIEHAAEGMMAEQSDADEIIENAALCNEDGKEMDEEQKKEFKNSCKKLHGTKLHTAILTATGMRVENMSPEAMSGAFRAQLSFAQSGRSKTAPVVAGAKLMNKGTSVETKAVGTQRTALERLGFK